MEVLITLFYLLFCACVVYPPSEFIAAGFTIPQLLEPLIGSESVDFVHHHARRACVTAAVHASLPLGYVVSLLYAGWQPEQEIVTRAFITLCLGAPVIALALVVYWCRDNYRWHPVIGNLAMYAGDRLNYMQVANSVNEEFKSVDKISIQMNAVSKVVATQNWIIKTSFYSVHFAHHSDTSLVAVNTDTHNLSISGESETQYVSIEVRPERAGVRSFFIRINSTDFKDLQDKVSRPITVLPSVNFQASIMDRFIAVFRSHVEANPEYIAMQELELCVGCMQNLSNVKIQKRCLDPPPPERPCTDCHCRPMWCVDCIGRWWASRHADSLHDTWLAATCSCPLCRASFCLLDVRPVRAHAA